MSLMGHLRPTRSALRASRCSLLSESDKFCGATQRRDLPESDIARCLEMKEVANWGGLSPNRIDHFGERVVPVGEKDTGNVSARFVVENDESFPLLGPSKKFATVMLIEVRVPKGTCAAGMPSQNGGFGILRPFHAIAVLCNRKYAQPNAWERGQSGRKRAWHPRARRGVNVTSLVAGSACRATHVWRPIFDKLLLASSGLP